MPKITGPIPAPYVNTSQSVQPDWVDLNGHMNIARVLATFDRAFDEVYADIGLTLEAIQKTGSSTFAAEMHITYQRELLTGDALRIETQLIGFDAKRMHWIQSMFNAREDYRAATAEWLILHVNLRQRRVAAMSDALQGKLREILQVHALLARPPQTGARVEFANRGPATQSGICIRR